MKRTKLRDRTLPDYTRGEEIFNMVSHIVGGGLGVVYLTLCVIFAAVHGNIWGVVGSAIYGASVICLFTMSRPPISFPMIIGPIISGANPAVYPR